jgi:hypothetical protein
MNQCRHIGLNTRRCLKLCAFSGTDFKNELNRRISFARQTFYLCIGGMSDGWVALDRSSVFHDLMLRRSSLLGPFVSQNCNLGAEVGRNASHLPLSSAH